MTTPQPDSIPPLILVTGGSGCVGTQVCLRAKELGLPVRGLVRSTSETTALIHHGIPVEVADLLDLGSLDRVVAGVTTVVHCAARIGAGPSEEYRRLHVHGLRNLLYALEQAGSVTRFIHLSSLSVHAARDHFGTDETTSPTVQGLGACLASLVEAENQLHEWSAREGVPVTVLRPGLLYGPGERWVLPQLLRRLKEQRFRYIGSGEQQLSNTYVGNLADAVFAAIATPAAAGQTYHITDLPLVTQRDFISTLCELAGYPVPRAALPLFWAQLSKWFPRWFRPNDEHDETAVELRLLGWNRGFSIEKARRELNYTPRVSFADGMRTTIDWYRAQGVLNSTGDLKAGG